MPESSDPVIFFPTPTSFRRWLRANHATSHELWVGFHRKASGRPSITWPEAVDEALCYGWIDGLRKGLDPPSYKIRFTPRKANSNWSLVNIGRVKELTRIGRMQSMGLRAFAARTKAKSGVYSYETRKRARLTPAQQNTFRQVPAAWKFFCEQSPSYRQLSTLWVVSAKKEETRRRRLQTLVEDSAARRKIKSLDYPRP